MTPGKDLPILNHSKHSLRLRATGVIRYGDERKEKLADTITLSTEIFAYFIIIDQIGRDLLRTYALIQTFDFWVG